MVGEMLSFDEALNEIGRELRAPPGFLNSIIKESDWSLIVKLHALIESAVTCMLCSCLGRPREMGSHLEL